MAAKTSGAPKLRNNLPPDVAAIVAGLEQFLGDRDTDGRKWCDAKCGVYAFYDYDREPIYIGQTKEQLRVRIRRHMTNQRTDAVAMRVLDPLEVAEVAVWPYWEFQQLALTTKANKDLVSNALNAAEYTLYQTALAESRIGRILNEKIPVQTPIVALPPGHRRLIVPSELWDRLSHPDERISRRALKISELAQVIRQRDVSVGLRNTLVTQAERLLLLASQRYQQIVGAMPKAELEAELFGPEDQAEEGAQDI